MHPRGFSARASTPAHAPHARRIAIVIATMLAALLAGCSHNGSGEDKSSGSDSAKTVSCGKTKTAANVPVDVEVAEGDVSCSTALAIEQDYAQAIRSGLAPGNGGGGPIRVHGWTCQGFATPIVLQTGKTSKCVRGDDVIIALLPTSAQ